MKHDLVLILHLQEPGSLFFKFTKLVLANAAALNGHAKFGHT